MKTKKRKEPIPEEMSLDELTGVIGKEKFDADLEEVRRKVEEEINEYCRGVYKRTDKVEVKLSDIELQSIKCYSAEGNPFGSRWVIAQFWASQELCNLVCHLVEACVSYSLKLAVVETHHQGVSFNG